MGETISGSQDLVGLLLILALAVVSVTGAVLHSRHEWKALRHRLFGKDDSAAKVSRPGRIAGRLASAEWSASVRESLEKARGDLEGESASFEASADAWDGLPDVVTSTARKAMDGGELRSSLVRLEGGLIYVLAIPWRPEDRRKFRGYEAFAEGWPAHAEAIRRSIGEQGPPMVGLLYFLGVDAREVTLMVAYEGKGVRRYPADLAGPTDVPGARSGLVHEFATA